MTLDQFAAMVKAIKYKRGYELSAHLDWRHGSVRVSLLAGVPDAGNPERYISVHQHEWFSYEDLDKCDAEVMLYRIRDFLLAFERHEHDEWFTIDGRKPFDPHTKGDPADVVMAALPGETYERVE